VPPTNTPTPTATAKPTAAATTGPTDTAAFVSFGTQLWQIRNSSAAPYATLTNTSASLKQNANTQSGLLTQLDALATPGVPASAMLDYTTLRDDLKDLVQARLENTLTLEVPGSNASIDAYSDLDAKFVAQLTSMATARGVNFSQTFKS
jgi:hypothetical protein